MKSWEQLEVVLLFNVLDTTECLTCRCPFLALSATIGNPQQVTSWLQSVKDLQQQQDSKLGLHRPPAAYQVRLIQHSERYADLRYHTFAPSPTQQNDASLRSAEMPLNSDASSHDFIKMHPCAVLTTKQIQESGFPSEISLEPCDCLQLYSIMHSTVGTVEQSIKQRASAELPASHLATDEQAAATKSLVSASAGVSLSPGTNADAGADEQDIASALAGAYLNPGTTPDAASDQGDADHVIQQWVLSSKALLQMLSPDKYFSSPQQIFRAKVREWEAQLKHALVTWATEHGSAGCTAVQHVITQLRDRSQDSSNIHSGSGNSPQDFYRMLRSLDNREMLPLLTFCFERTKCERLAGKS